MKAAVDNGAEVVVAAGFLQGAALEKAAKEFTDTKFVFIDGSPVDGVTNLAAISFREEQCGYLAGYAAVMEGYTKLGFCGGGGGTNDACCRYGYGYVQGAEAAAAEKNVKVEMNYTWKYGESFQPSAELQTLASGWYKNGTEVIFSCGGSIFDSITAAASANDAAVIGVDVDQSYTSDTVITSALKGIGEAAQQALTAAYGSDWANYGGKLTTLARPRALLVCRPTPGASRTGPLTSTRPCSRRSSRARSALTTTSPSSPAPITSPSISSSNLT